MNYIRAKTVKARRRGAWFDWFFINRGNLSSKQLTLKRWLL